MMDYYCRNCHNIFVPLKFVYPEGYVNFDSAMAVCTICGSNATEPNIDESIESLKNKTEINEELYERIQLVSKF